VRIRINKGFWASWWGLSILGAFLFVVLGGIGVFTYYWIHFSHMIDARLSGRVDQTTARIYSAPGRIRVGEPITAGELASRLQRSGYAEFEIEGAPGQYKLAADTLEIHPSEDSYFNGHNALRVDFDGAKIERIRALDSNQEVSGAEIEPELLTNLFDSSREKRRIVRYDDIPVILRNALLAAEDQRFFEHPGFDPVRILGAAWADLRHGKVEQGASTLDMQVARSFFFTGERTWNRKLAETMVSLELERRFSKQQIFEMYANEIYLGNRGSFAIHGFAEGSYAYFNKDIHDLTLGEAAFLTGIIRAPNRYSTADRRPERAEGARNRVLAQMLEAGMITPDQEHVALKTPLHLISGGIEGSSAPYFVDMVQDHLLDRFSESDLLSQSLRVYTTLDPDLQSAATEAAKIGIQNVDEQLARKYARWRKQGDTTEAQIAIIVIDPKTGEIKALVGGRDYGQSQLNHVLARRQPGSAFKPFVYAAAFQSGVDGSEPVVTPATTVDDEPTTFDFDGKEYTPNNYGEQFHGTVTLREALTFSMNVATVKVAEMVGYDRVASMARQLGLGSNIQATPAVALGAYEMTPMEVAAGYTIFADGGIRAEPMFLTSVINADGTALERNDPRTRQVMDPRVAYLVTNILEDVINHGTGYPVRARGFTAPAAGKTGTSRDGWFAGYTSNLECIVWVGFDDNRDLGLSGGNSAAPIWAELMKRAVALPAYRDTQPFEPPDGVTTVMIDPETLQLATPQCPVTREEVYIRGTEPTEFCEKHGGKMFAQEPSASWLSRIFGGADKEPPPPSANGSQQPKGSTSASAAQPNQPGQNPPQPAEDTSKKKSFLQRIFGIFGSSGNQKDTGPPKQGAANPQP
jgi:penicillin-binding protein 1B